MKRRLLICVTILIVYACTRPYQIYSNKYPVFFSCDITQSPFNSLNTLGYFLAVRPTATQTGYRVTLPDGIGHDFLYTEIQSRVFRFGLAGLIIGRPYFANNEIYAYDWGCPECDRSSTRLQIDIHGVATCPKCYNSYDLNNEGISKSGSTHPLYRYHTTMNGNSLMIHN